MTKPTILVTGVGAIIGYGIINSLRRSGLDARIVGMDIYEDAHGRHLSDEFVQAVPAADGGYLAFVQRVVAERRVDLIIPGIEQDLYALWDHREKIPTKIVLNNDRCIRLSKSKLETFRHFDALGAPFVIPTIHSCSYVECVARLGLPFILKPCFSYASKGFSCIHSAEEFAFYTTRVGVGKCVYQKRIGTDEDEYTISVFGDGAGGYSDSIILRRTLSRDGATQKAYFVSADAAIMGCVDAVCQNLEPICPTNFQIRKEQGRAFLLEINPRISSACSIRAALGYNEPEMCVRYYLRHETPKPVSKRKGHVVRFIDDHVIDG
jgi:carbamoyl-phosphate synthase large subunit